MNAFKTHVLPIFSVQLSVYFSTEIPHRVAFSNDTGTSIHCHANGTPTPKVKWTTVDRAPLTQDSDLRKDLGNGTLQFSSFSVEEYQESIHAASYICIASNYRGVIVSNEVHVCAVVKQHYEVQVYDEFVIEGNNGLIKCQIPSFVEEHIQVVSWTTDTGDIYTKTRNAEEERFMMVSKGDLYISKVHMVDGLKSFICKTINLLTGEAKFSNPGRIIITDTKSIMPPRITHTSSNIRVHQGERVELICTSQGYPEPNYRWFKVSDKNMASVGDQERIRQWESLLIFSQVQVSDSGSYKCVVTNSVGEDSAEIGLWVNARLDIQVSPKIQTVDIGKSAAMTCIANGYPPRTYFSWFQNGVAVTFNKRISFTAGKILTIAGVQREDQGIYQCFIGTEETSAFGAAELKLGKVLPEITAHFPANAVLVESQVSLECIARGNPTPAISWFRDGSPLKTLKPDTFVSANGDVTSFLNISSIKAEDGGEYQCDARNVVGTSSHSAKLNVIGPPFVRAMKNVSVMAGHTAVIQCKVTGYPISSIIWKKGGFHLPLDPRQQVHPNGTLLIQFTDKASDAGVYVCVARNNEGESSSGSIALSVTIPPQIAPIFFPPKLYIGTRARLQCVITDGDIPVTFLWLKDGYPLSDHLELIVKQDDEFSSSLTFPSIHTRHNGNYTCVARNVAATTNFSASLVVDVPPFWIFNPVDTSVVLGNSIMLSCTADGYPKPQILWKRVRGNGTENYHDLSHTNENYKMFANGSFLIRRATQQDEGNYLCHAQNGIGPGITKVIYLSVEAGAYFDVKAQNVTSKKGDSVTLLAVAKGDHPIKMSWKLNGLKINGNVDYRYTIKHQPTSTEVMSVLEISGVDIRDSGAYSCAASNAFGKDESVFHLSVRDNPDPPENVKILDHYSRYVRLNWIAPFDGGTVIKYYIIQYKNGSDEWRESLLNMTVFHPETTAVIQNLWPGSAYSFRVMAMNEVGVGKPSNGVGIRTSEEAPSGPPIGVEAFAETSQSIRVKWKPPPAEDHNGEIKGYNVGFKKYGTSEPYSYRTVDAGVSGHDGTTLTDLSKYTKYIVNIRAYNRIGPGPSSEEVVVTTKEDVPSEPPANIHCTSTSTVSMDIAWDPPPKNAQNGILQSFKLMYCPLVTELHGNGKKFYQLETSKSQDKVFSSAVLSATIHGLQKYTNYSIQMLATTEAGDGVMSSSVFCRTREDVPDSPADIKAITKSSNIILIAWKPPENPNGKIVAYNLYVRRANSSFSTKLKPKRHVIEATDGLKFEVRGLQEGETYDFWVTASTSIGEGSSTRVVTHAAQFKAGAKIAAFSDRIVAYWLSNISFMCPATGMPSPTRTWMLKSAPKTSTRLIQNNDGTLFIHRVLQLDAGNYTCVAKNIYGNDQITYELVVIGPPQPPLIGVSKVASHSVWLTIRTFGHGGTPIRGYLLNYKEVQGKYNEVNIAAKDENVLLKNLRCGTGYQVFLIAYNDVGAGEASNILSVNTKGTVPAAPKHDDIIQANDTAISISLFRWSPNDCIIQYFSVQYRRKSHHSWIFVLDNVPPSHKEVYITHLEPGASYELKITARNEAGTTVVQYFVTTVTHIKGSGGIYTVRGNETVATPFYKDVSILIPVTASAIATAAILVGVCICIHHSRKLNGVAMPEKSLQSEMLQAHSQSKEFEISEVVSNTTSYQHNQHSLSKSYKNGEETIFRDDPIWYPYPTQKVPITQMCTNHSSTLHSENSIMLVLRASRDTTEYQDDKLSDTDLDVKNYISQRQFQHRPSDYISRDSNKRDSCCKVGNNPKGETVSFPEWDIEDRGLTSLTSPVQTLYPVGPTGQLNTFNRHRIGQTNRK